MSCGVWIVGGRSRDQEAFVVICCRDVVPWIIAKLILHFGLIFRRVMGVRTCESRCLFSGSKGEVCCIEPLHSKPELKDHPITQFSLLAMASLTKVFRR